MSDPYIESTTRLTNYLKDRPWLFKKVPQLTLQQYIEYFNYLNRSDLYYFPFGLPYKIDLLENYKDKIYNSYYIAITTGMAFHTMIQLSQFSHLILMWGNTSTNRETVVYPTLYTNDPTEYTKLISSVEKFIYSDIPSAALHFGSKA